MRKSKLKTLYISIFLYLSILILGVSVFGRIIGQKNFSPRKVLAAEVLPTATEESIPTEISTPTPPPAGGPKVDYYLVYPGILPDHFLYPLKMVRDRIWLLLTTGAKRKAEVMLLFADKRLGAGKALIEGGKERLGVTTVTKGEKYLEQAVGQLKIARDKGQDIDNLQEKFTKAAAKHEEVLLELKEKVSTEEWGAMDQMLEKNKIIREEIEKLQ